MSQNEEWGDPSCEMKMMGILGGRRVALHCYASGYVHICTYCCELSWPCLCCANGCSHGCWCQEMAMLNQRYDCCDFVLCACGTECPRGAIIVFALETNDPCLGSEPMLTEKKTKTGKRSSFIVVGFWTKSGVCQTRFLLKWEFPASLGLVKWKGKAARWGPKSKIYNEIFVWMKCQKRGLAVKPWKNIGNE